MTITINIAAETPEEVMSAITKLALFGKVETSVAPQEKKPAARTTKPVEPAKAPEPEKPVEETPNVEPKGNPNVEESGDQEYIPTVVDLRKVAQEKGTTPEGKKAIKDLLNSFDSKSISDVPENKRKEFLAALEAL